MEGCFLEKQTSSRLRSAAAGGAAGLANGFFGGGGGMILVPLLTRWCGLDQRPGLRHVHRHHPAPVRTLLGDLLPPGRAGSDGRPPYLAGGLAGGFLGGRVFKRLNMTWLRRAFALLILYGGVKALLF